MRTKQNPMDLGANCAVCPLAFKGKPKPDYVMGGVPDEVVGVLIGEGPGHEEAACGRPFTGNTGRLLDESLQAAGLSRKNLAVLNATCCRPGPDDGPDVRMAAGKCCKPALMAQLGEHVGKPKLLMGAVAAAQFTKLVKGAVSFMRGFVREEINAIITWHPTYAYFKNTYEWAVFEADLGRLARLVSGNLEFGPTKILTTPTDKDLDNLVAGSGGTIAVDIETNPVDPAQEIARYGRTYTGVDPTRAVLRSIQFGTEDEAVSFLWAEATHELQSETKRILEDPNIVKVWCNGYWFDLRVLKRYGMVSVNNEDLRDMRCALSATAELSLRNMGSLYTDLPPWKELGMDETEK